MALFGKKTKSEDKEDKKDAAVSMQDLYAEKAASAKTGTKKAASKYTDAYRVLVKPLITEKATNLSGQNKYIFAVAGNANKIAIAKAVQAVYGVKPLKVNLINIPGKRVARGRISGQRSDRHKAIITLAKGESIKVYEGV